MLYRDDLHECFTIINEFVMGEKHEHVCEGQGSTRMRGYDGFMVYSTVCVSPLSNAGVVDIAQYLIKLPKVDTFSLGCPSRVIAAGIQNGLDRPLLRIYPCLKDTVKFLHIC